MDRISDTALTESAICACCNTATMSARGLIRNDARELCTYLVRWTRADLAHPVGIFIRTAPPGEPLGITVEYRFPENGFRIVDHDHFAWPPPLIVDGMRFIDRDDIIGQPGEQWTYDILDLIWGKDPHIPRPRAQG